MQRFPSGLKVGLLLAFLVNTSWLEARQLNQHPFKSGAYMQLGGESFSIERFKESSPLELVSTPGLFLNAASPIHTNRYGFAYQGVKLCQHEIKEHTSPSGEKTYWGSLAEVSKENLSHLQASWPAKDKVSKLAQNYLSRHFSLLEADHQIAKILQAQPCWWDQENSLTPALMIEALTISGNLHKFYSSEQEILLWQHASFELKNAVSTVYPRSPRDQLESFQLGKVNTDDSDACLLSNNFFKVYGTSGGTIRSAQSCDFSYDTSQSAFRESSLFTNANRHIQWLESNGYNNFGSIPVKIEANCSFNSVGECVNNPVSDSQSNNALYLPVSGGPIIRVGNGDGLDLENLAVDADVVSHEIGHHVVYASVTRIDKSEPLVIHEGLADYLTFARSEDPCLGRSICPASSRICAVEQTCLRTAINDYRLDSANLPSAPHLRSQFISGMLWDLSAEDGIAVSDVTKMLLTAIELMVADSGYQHLVLAMMLADDALYSGQYCETIYNRAIDRGMASLLEDISCSKAIPKLEVEEESSTPSAGEGGENSVIQVKNSSKSSGGLCGQIGMKTDHAWSLFVLLVLPALVMLRREAS